MSRRSRLSRKKGSKKRSKSMIKHETRQNNISQSLESNMREREYDYNKHGRQQQLAEFKAKQRKKDILFVVLLIIFTLIVVSGFFFYDTYIQSEDSNNSDLNIESQGNQNDNNNNNIPQDQINWLNYNDGMDRSKTKNLPVIIDFYADWCGPCQNMDKELYTDSRVIAKSRSFVMIKVNGDYNGGLMDQYNVNSYPTIVFLDAEQHEVDRWVGWGYDLENQRLEFLSKMDQVE